MKYLCILLLLIPFSYALCETDADCNDFNPCTINKCIGPTGDQNGCSISHTPLGTPCSDEYQCTEQDICDGQGRCEGTPNNQRCLTHCGYAECNPKTFTQTGCGNYQACNSIKPLINHFKQYKQNNLDLNQLQEILNGWIIQ